MRTVPEPTTPLGAPASGSWYDFAACKGMDPEPWYQTHPEAMAGPKAVCASCPVWRPCLAVALTRREKYGIWGGLSASERRRLLARIRKDARDGAVAHEVPQAGEAEEAALVEEALARAEEAGVGTAPRRRRAKVG